MDKFVTLCFDCRTLIGEYYRLEAYDADTDIPGAEKRKNREAPACENCGQRYGLKVCRVRTNTKGEHHG